MNPVEQAKEPDDRMRPDRNPRPGSESELRALHASVAEASTLVLEQRAQVYEQALDEVARRLERLPRA